MYARAKRKRDWRQYFRSKAGLHSQTSWNQLLWDETVKPSDVSSMRHPYDADWIPGPSSISILGCYDILNLVDALVPIVYLKCWKNGQQTFPSESNQLRFVVVHRPWRFSKRFLSCQNPRNNFSSFLERHWSSLTEGERSSVFAEK